MKPRHSILVITYKQEKLISECLDSILSQSVTPYEVIVIDDCSPDGTWNVVQKYAAKYPDIIKPYRNSKNEGVFKNVNRIKEMPTGDFVNFVAGDDKLPYGILEKYNKYVEENKLNCNIPFIIYTNAKIIMPDGRSVIINNYCNRNINTIELTLLCSFYVWDTGMSIELVRQMPPIREDVGYQADWLQHFQRILCCEQKEYFINEVGYIYRQGVGVTVATTAQKQIDSKLAMMEIFQKQYPHTISTRVNNYFKFEKAYFDYNTSPSLLKYLKMLQQRFITGSLPKNNSFRQNFKMFIPIQLKSVIKRMLCQKSQS